MSELGLSSELFKRSQEISKANASNITPKTGSSIAFNKYFCKAGLERVKNLQAEAKSKISANTERYSDKVAQEINQPIVSELTEAINSIKTILRDHVNKNIDARIQRINETRNVPVRESSMKLFQTIKMLLDLGADISESDWKSWGEQCAGHYLEERIFGSLAQTRNITYIQSFDPEKSIERLEHFRTMANIAINHLDNADENINAASFFNDNPNSPLAKLINDIDTDIASIIPAERLSVLKRLKDAKENAFDKNDSALSVRIGMFIDKNIDKLATPEEISESLFDEAESFIKQGMTATKEV